MDNNLLYTAEQAVSWILRSVPKYQLKKEMNRNLSENDIDEASDSEVDFSFMTAELKQAIEKRCVEIEKSHKEELERNVLYGEFGDGLSDLFILTGKIDTLQSVINLLKSTSSKEDMDFEFLEIDSKTLTREYVDKLREPNGKDGGFIVIKDFSSFAAIPDINTQIYILSKIMRNPFGLKCTGWHIIFTEDTIEKDKWWPNSCIHYFQQKSFLKCWYVE